MITRSREFYSYGLIRADLGVSAVKSQDLTSSAFLRHLLVFASIILCGFSFSQAAELVGHWTSDFDSQIGPQKYTFDFTRDGTALTGKATYDHSMGKGESKIVDIKVSGDAVSFVEPLNLGGNEIKVTYSGKLSGDEMKLTRVVGDFGTEEIVAKRADAAKSADAK